MPISIHALCEEGDRAVSRMPSPYRRFLSTPSARRATMYSARAPRTSRHFYPRPLRGGRPRSAARSPTLSHFYPRPLRGGRRTAKSPIFWFKKFLSTPSARRATSVLLLSFKAKRFLSTPSARRATEFPVHNANREIISIHALCEEGDAKIQVLRSDYLHFYPRPLRGGRPCQASLMYPSQSFLSTPSARRATLCCLTVFSI